jgi:uncharacterized repeat protein (TIGR03987 family)
MEMSGQLLVAIIAMISALLLYTVGVWSERIAGRLKTWHLVLFWIGFIFDTTGTTLMGQIAGKMDFDLHGITGALAIILMLSHAIWASVVLRQKNEKAIVNFHKFSILVWLVWLVPFFTGMAGAMIR